MTRAFIAPEGYAILGATIGMGINLSGSQLRDAVVRAYAKWQRLSFAAAARLFAPTS